MPTDPERQPVLPEPGFRAITVIVYSDGTVPTYDLGGIDPWAAQNILTAICNELWTSLPAPQREET